MPKRTEKISKKSGKTPDSSLPKPPLDLRGIHRMGTGRDGRQPKRFRKEKFRVGEVRREICHPRGRSRSKKSGGERLRILECVRNFEEMLIEE